MNKYILILMFCWSHQLQAQRLFQAPFVSYLGRGIEDHKVSIFGRLPYEGIGKKMLLEHYPQLWRHTFSRYSTPSHALIDAFGAVGPNFRYVPKTTASLLLDQFGNLEGDFSARNNLKRCGFLNQFNQQIRSASDINRNQRLDFAPGQQFTAQNAWNYRHGKFSTGLNSYFVKSNEYGGSRTVKTQQETGLPLDGYTQDAQHWQLALWANLREFSWGNLGVAIDLNRHRQDLDWKTYTYRGREQQTSYLFTYQHEWKHNQVYAAWQSVQDAAQEQVDSVQIMPKDQYWRGIVEWGHTLNERFFLKSRINVEKHLEQGLTFRPALQLDWKIDDSEKFILSIFANSGQRLNKPLTLHLERLRDEYSIEWKVTQPYEIAHKVGLNFTGAILRNRFVKATLDHTWFKHKIITRWEHDARRLLFSNSPGVLRRDALEFTTGGWVIPGKNLDVHLIYRWEQWTPDVKLPWQANHAAQLRLQWLVGRSQFSAHYLLRSPQQIMKLLPVDASTEYSPGYHRLDLGYVQRFKHGHRTKHWSNHFSLQLECINVLGAGRSGRQFETSLFWPDAQEPYWSDPQLRNFQLTIRHEF